MTTRKRQTEASDPPRRRRPGGRNAEVREAVRRAALELLAEGGFGAVSLPAMCLLNFLVYRNAFRSECERRLVTEAAS